MKTITPHDDDYSLFGRPGPYVDVRKAVIEREKCRKERQRKTVVNALLYHTMVDTRYWDD